MPSPTQEYIAKQTYAKYYMQRKQRKSTQDRQSRQKGTTVFKRSKYRCSSNCINLDNPYNHKNPKYSENSYNSVSPITWYIASPILKCKRNSKRKTSTKSNQRQGTHNNSSFNLSTQWDIANDKQKQRKENLLATTTESYLRSTIDLGIIEWFNKIDQNPIIDETCNFFNNYNNNEETESSLLSIKSTICNFTNSTIQDKILVDNTIFNKSRKLNNNYYYSLFDNDDSIMMASDEDNLSSVNEDTDAETSATGDETSGEIGEESNETGDEKVADVKTPKFTKVASKKMKNKIALLLEKSKGVKNADIKPMDSSPAVANESVDKGKTEYNGNKDNNKFVSNDKNETTTALFNDKSNKFVPKNMPTFKGWTPKCNQNNNQNNHASDDNDYDKDYEDYDDDNTRKLGVNIRIDLQKKKKLTVDNVRLFYAIFKALKIAHSQFYVSPINEEGDFIELFDPTQTPTNEKELENYLEEPTMSRRSLVLLVAYI